MYLFQLLRMYIATRNAFFQCQSKYEDLINTGISEKEEELVLQEFEERKEEFLEAEQDVISKMKIGDFQECLGEIFWFDGRTLRTCRNTNRF